MAAAILFRVGADDESSNPPEEVGCFERIEGTNRQTICPP